MVTLASIRVVQLTNKHKVNISVSDELMGATGVSAVEPNRQFLIVNVVILLDL